MRSRGRTATRTHLLLAAAPAPALAAVLISVLPENDDRHGDGVRSPRTVACRTAKDTPTAEFAVTRSPRSPCPSRAWSRWRCSTSGMSPDPSRRVLFGTTPVGEDGWTYVLLTMAAGAKGLTTVASYWSAPPLPQGGTAAHNPQTHPGLSDGGRPVLSYDVDLFEPSGAAVLLSRNVPLYRPRVVTIRRGR